jgi:hypothetical protein
LLSTCPCQACATARKYIEADGFELYMSPSFANNSDGKRQLQAREIPTAYCSLSTLLRAWHERAKLSSCD